MRELFLILLAGVPARAALRVSPAPIRLSAPSAPLAAAAVSAAAAPSALLAAPAATPAGPAPMQAAADAPAEVLRAQAEALFSGAAGKPESGLDSELETALAAPGAFRLDFETGLQAAGKLSELIRDGKSGLPAYVQFTGPVQLAHWGRELPGQGVDDHASGYGSALGPVEGLDRPLSALRDEELAAIGLVPGKPGEIRFRSGVVVTGLVRGFVRGEGGALLLISFARPTVVMGPRVLFKPSWGIYDLAAVETIRGVTSGAADPGRYLPYRADTYSTAEMPPMLERRGDGDLLADNRVEISARLNAILAEFPLASAKIAGSPRVRLQRATDGGVIARAQNIRQSFLSLIMSRVHGERALRAMIDRELQKPWVGALDFDYPFPGESARVESSPRAEAPRRGNALLSGRFQGMHAFPEFQSARDGARAVVDSLYPRGEWASLGVEDRFGTRLEDASELVGLELAGVDVVRQGTLFSPLIEGEVKVFMGRVLSVRRTNQDVDADPLWVAEIEEGGTTRVVDLNWAIGLRVRRSKAASLASRLTEQTRESRQRRRRLAAESFAAARAGKGSPPPVASRLESKLRRLPDDARRRLAGFRRDAERMLGGRSAGRLPAISFLHRAEYDRTPRPLRKLKDESMRPLVEEVQRQLYDTEGERGFNRWLADLALEAAADAALAGRLRWGDRAVALRDPNHNVPFAEGRHGMPRREAYLADVPLLSETDLLEVLDRRIALYGFDTGIGDGEGLRFVTRRDGSPSRLVTLDTAGLSFDEMTQVFSEYSRRNLLFLDTYFKGKPHGQYAHVFQWLYLAERLSQPGSNAFGANVLDALAKLQPYFQDDFVNGVWVTDYVGQRAPQNPDHVNNLARLLFDVD